MSAQANPATSDFRGEHPDALRYAAYGAQPASPKAARLAAPAADFSHGRPGGRAMPPPGHAMPPPALVSLHWDSRRLASLPSMIKNSTKKIGIVQLLPKYSLGFRVTHLAETNSRYLGGLRHGEPSIAVIGFGYWCDREWTIERVGSR